MTLLCYINCRNGIFFAIGGSTQRVNRHHHTGCYQHRCGCVHGATTTGYESGSPPLTLVKFETAIFYAFSCKHQSELQPIRLEVVSADHQRNIDLGKLCDLPRVINQSCGSGPA